MFSNPIMKKHAKSHKAAASAAKKLPDLSKDLHALLQKHGVEGAKITGIELRMDAPAGAGVAAPAAPVSMSGCVVLPDGSIWCG